MGRWGGWWAGLAVFRLLNAVAVQTSYVPDEQWQSLEVAHRAVFGYGHLTWEWRLPTPIRGCTHPALFAGLMWLLRALGIDASRPLLIPVAARCLQGLLMCFCDASVYRLALRQSLGSHATARWTMAAWLGAWFVLYCAPRTLSNTLEMVLTACALSVLPSPDAPSPTGLTAALALVGLACLVRPTAVLVWGPAFVLRAFDTSLRTNARELVGVAAPMAACTLALSLCIDRLGYGQWVLVQYEFFKFNVLQSNSGFYGTNGLGWYFYNGWPGVLGAFLPFFLLGVAAAPARQRREPGLWTLLCATCALSLIGHKEHRFLLPLMPLAFPYIGAGCQAAWRRRRWRWLVALAFAVNVTMAGYLGLVHQRGPLDIIPPLQARLKPATDASPGSRVLFLMPCHSVPLYSHVHVNASLEFLECPPPHVGEDEASQFYRAPQQWLEDNCPWGTATGAASPSTADVTVAPPRQQRLRSLNATHVVLFSGLAPQIAGWLAALDFQLCERVFHAHFPIDAQQSTHIALYCRA